MPVSLRPRPPGSGAAVIRTLSFGILTHPYCASEGEKEKTDNADDPRDHRAWRQYNITSLPQEGINNRTVFVSMGHCVGGSSAINGMAVMRGTRREYNVWAELGNKGSTWGWDGMLPYFRRVGILHLLKHQSLRTWLCAGWTDGRPGEEADPGVS